MKVRPLQDRVLIRRVAEEEKTKGGIIIPDSAKEKPADAAQGGIWLHPVQAALHHTG